MGSNSRALLSQAFSQARTLRLYLPTLLRRRPRPEADNPGRTLTIEEAIDGGSSQEGTHELTQYIHGKLLPGHAA